MCIWVIVGRTWRTTSPRATEPQTSLDQGNNIESSIVGRLIRQYSAEWIEKGEGETKKTIKRLIQEFSQELLYGLEMGYRSTCAS